MKLKPVYVVSFWFGVVYLVLKLLSIPSMFMLFHKAGVGFSEFMYYLSVRPFVANVVYFGSPVADILVGILIITISYRLIRNKISANKMMNIGAAMLTLVALVMGIWMITTTILVVLTPSIQTLSNLFAKLSGITYPIFPIFFFVSILLIVGGYIKEKLKTSSRKDTAVLFPSISLAIIILVDILQVFRYLI